jgi:hypothetical protein
LRHCSGAIGDGQFIAETKINRIKDLVASLRNIIERRNAFKNKDLRRSVKDGAQECASFEGSGAIASDRQRSAH